MNENDKKIELRNACQFFQLFEREVKSVPQSDYWRELSSIIRSITPDIKLKVGDK